MGDKAAKRLFMIGNSALFQLISAFSTAIIAYFVYSKESVAVWGQFAGIWLLVTMLTIVFNFGSKDFLLKEFSLSGKPSREVCNQYLWLRLPLLIGTILFLLLYVGIEQNLRLIPLVITAFVVNSYQPLLIFEKRFKLLLSAEVIAILAQLFFLYNQEKQLELNMLLSSFLIYNLIKFLVMMLVFFKHLKTPAQYQLIHLKPLWPFFLLTLGGLLVNKSDFMIVAALMDDSSKAHYQVISTFSTMGIIAAHAVLQPFIKQIYRVNNALLNKISLNYFLAGIIISLLYIVLVQIVITFLFNFQISLLAKVFLYCIELIFFAINPLVFNIFRNEKQQKFVSIVLVSGIFSLLFAALLVKPYGITGALFANFLGNCLMLTLLFFTKRKINSEH